MRRNGQSRMKRYINIIFDLSKEELLKNLIAKKEGNKGILPNEQGKYFIDLELRGFL